MAEIGEVRLVEAPREDMAWGGAPPLQLSTAFPASGGV